MIRRFVRAVVRNATVTHGDALALRLDPVVLRSANLLPLEEVEVVNHLTGERVTTFVEAGAPGEIRAPRMRAGDAISILSWGLLHDGQTLAHQATIVTLDAHNGVVSIATSQNQ
ncbi:MAG: aspartate 1-decarboxylase [Acidobacteria bacterium]|nr:aspartate 1-decarboxylase [Acidobacteriota bacterium]MBV9475733.1 aspartate 1-decarboxylase [Acidobacteriota bacterium]